MLTAQFPSNIRTFRPVPLPLRGEGLGVGGTRPRDLRSKLRSPFPFIKCFRYLSSVCTPPPTPPRQGEGGSGATTLRAVPLPLRGEGLGVGEPRVRDPHRARPLAKGS